MPRPKKVAEPSEPVSNAPTKNFDANLAIEALKRAKELVESINMTNLAIQSQALRDNITLPIEYGIETIKELSSEN